MPSGHVAAAFSAAFAMWLAVPERRSIAWTLLVIAVLVWVSAVYSRYDYAAALAAVALCAAVIGVWASGSRLRTSGKAKLTKPEA